MFICTKVKGTLDKIIMHTVKLVYPYKKKNAIVG